MNPRHTSSAEWQVLATVARDNQLPAGLAADLFADTAARRVFGWMLAANAQFGQCSPLAVGSLLERRGFAVDAVDATVDMLVETAPLVETANFTAAIGFLIEQHGLRSDTPAQETIVRKHRAGCRLTEQEINLLQHSEEAA